MLESQNFNLFSFFFLFFYYLQTYIKWQVVIDETSISHGPINIIFVKQQLEYDTLIIMKIL